MCQILFFQKFYIEFNLDLIIITFKFLVLNFVCNFSCYMIFLFHFKCFASFRFLFEKLSFEYVSNCHFMF